MKYYVVFFMMLLNVSVAQADMSDCKAMYVGLLGNNQDAGNAHFALKNSFDDNVAFIPHGIHEFIILRFIS